MPDHACPKHQAAPMKSPAAGIYIFPDTQIFLHYKSLEEVDLSGLFSADSVVIVVAPVVLRELNDKNDSHPNPKLKKRAGTVIRMLGKWTDQPKVATIRKKVSVIFHPADPVNTDFAVHQLDATVNDDRLLATLIEFREKHPGARVVLLTADVGLRVKAHTRDIPIVELPDSLRLPDVPDSQEQELRKLRSELERLKAALPKPHLEFQSGGTVSKVQLRPPKLLDGMEVRRWLDEERTRHPKFEVNDGFVSSVDIRQPGWVPPDEAKRRNQLLDIYFQRYTEFLAALDEYERLTARRFSIELALVNDGGKPAKGIDISLAFPSSVKVYVRMDRVPGRPEPPAPPTWNFESTIVPRLTGEEGSVLLPPDSNVSRPYLVLDNTGPTTVRFDVTKAKHHGAKVLLPGILGEFVSAEAVQSFSFDYVLSVENLPEPVPGRLHLKLELVQ